MSLALAILLSAQTPAAPAAAAVPESFVLTCSLIGRDATRARFALAVAGRGDGRRFAIRAEDDSAWIGSITAARAGAGQVYHFVSGGTSYRLALELDPGDGPLTAHAELEEDRGLPALNVKRAEGSCRPSAEAASEVAALPAAPIVRGERPPHRPVPMREGRVPSDCTVVLRDLSELTFGLEATFDAAGIQFAVTPTAGQAWPASAFTLRGAMLAAIVQPPGGPPGGVLTVFGAAGVGPGDAAPAALNYLLRAESNLIESWIELRSALGDRQIVGAGHCSVRQGGNR
jgi:hypothetical protein